MCEATLHGHTALCVPPNFQKDQLPQRRSASKETWRSLISPFEMTNFLIKTADAHFASRSARRSRSFLRHPPASSPPCPPSPFPSRHSCRTTRKPDDGARRDFACTSTWPHDGALPKHAAPRAPATENDARHRPRGKYYQNYQGKRGFVPFVLPKLPKSPSPFFLAQMRVFRYRFRKPSSVCVAL